MGRVLGMTDLETDLADLMRAAERAGCALACIDADIDNLALPGDTPATPIASRLGAWTITLSLAAAFLVL